MRHPDSPAILRYIENMISVFTEPIEKVAWANWKKVMTHRMLWR